MILCGIALWGWRVAAARHRTNAFRTAPDVVK